MWSSCLATVTSRRHFYQTLPGDLASAPQSGQPLSTPQAEAGLSLGLKWWSAALLLFYPIRHTVEASVVFVPADGHAIYATEPGQLEFAPPQARRYNRETQSPAWPILKWNSRWPSTKAN